MLFKEAQSSMTLYIFDRNTISLETSQITNVIPSHFDANAPSGKLVVDITDNKSHKYTIDDSLTIAYFSNCAISLDRDAMLREIETFKNNSEGILNEIPRHEDIVSKCKILLVEHNPALKEKQENESRFHNIENSIGELKNMFVEFMEKLS